MAVVLHCAAAAGFQHEIAHHHVLEQGEVEGTAIGGIVVALGVLAEELVAGLLADLPGLGIGRLPASGAGGEVLGQKQGEIGRFGGERKRR
jgi:hypothetical protein